MLDISLIMSTHVRRKSPTILSSFRLGLLGISIYHWVVLIEFQADTIHTMPLICRGVVSLALEHVSKMSTTVAANNFCPGHSERAVGASRHGAWDVVEVCRPSTARLEFVVCLVERRIAGGAGIDTLFRHMLVIFSSEWSFSALFAEDAELV